jgi:uncharacterized membrane protein
MSTDLPEPFVQATAALRNAGCDPDKIRPEARAMLIRYAAGEITESEFEAYSQRLVREMNRG